MGFDFDERKTLLYADLFKPCKGEENQNMIKQYCTSTNQSSSFDSSSSGFSTPLGSELGSSESEDGDFIAELSRQMAECMLQDEEEERSSVTDTDTDAVKNLNYELNSTHPVFDVDRNRKSCLELRNQPPVSKRVPVLRGRRVKGAELTQKVQFQKTEENYRRCRRRDWRRQGQVGSGMQAIFLHGSGSRNGSSGTGVFLPRVDNHTVEPKVKSGLSTVLIPTRVLEALELHYNRFSDSAASTVRSPHHASPTDEWSRYEGQGSRHSKLQKEAADKDEEMQILPQEWTY